MPSHEEQLLAVLEKIGQPDGPASAEEVSATPAAVLDADTELSPTDGLRVVDPNPNPVPTVMEGPDERVLAPITRRNLFVHHDTHPVVFDIALLQHYDTDWLMWDSSTLWKEIKEDFRVPSISDHSKAKIQAVRTIHINEWFWTKWEVFCWINQALNNNLPDFQVMQKPSIAQMLNAVDVATMIRDGEEFTAEIQMFVAAAVVEEGVFYAPEPIAFCQDEIVQLLEHLQVDGFQEMIEAVRKRYVEVMSLSQDQWESAEGSILIEEPADVQVAKLKVASDYLSLRRRQLKQQLRLLA